MLAAALRRDARHGAFQDLEERLLHALAAHVARDARVLRLPRDLVDFVDVHDAALALGHVEITRLQQPHEDVLDVLADVSGLGERRGVGDREGHVEHPRERLREQRLAHAGRPEQEDVRLVQLDVVLPARGARVDALVVVVHGHGERLLGVFLADHVLVEDVLDLLRRRDLRDRFRDLALLVLRQDFIAQRDALVADVDRGPGNELPYRVLGLSAERAAQVPIVGHGRHGSRANLKGGTSGPDGTCATRARARIRFDARQSDQ